MVRIGLIVAAGALLIGAVLWAGSVGPWIGRPRGSTTDSDLPRYTPPVVTLRTPAKLDPPVTASAGGSFDPTIVLLVLGAILLVALLLIAVFLIRHRVPGRPAPRAAAARDNHVQPAPEAPDPTRAFDPRQAADYVIACWDQLEQQAAGRGNGRRPEQTPTEFLAALGSTYPLEHRAGAELLALYQRARFDHVRLLPDTAIRARACADTLLGALGSLGASGASGAPGGLGKARQGRQ